MKTLFTLFILFSAVIAHSGSNTSALLTEVGRLESDAEDAWEKIPKLVTKLSFDEAGSLKESDYLKVIKRQNLAALLIINGNQTQNYIAIKEADGKTSWINVPEGFRRITDAVLTEKDSLILTGYYHVDNYESFLAFYKRTNSGWKVDPTVFKGLPEEIGGAPAEVTGYMEGPAAWPALVFGDPESPEMISLELKPGPAVLVNKATKLIFSNNRFVLQN